MPLVLAVVLLVLVLLLRSLLAPVLLLVTVIVSYAASLGAATLVLDHLLDMPALDAGVPLLSFLFLVALGVDYNIFLVTRAREETAARGDTRAAMVRALAATGGVITSAGILLAAVFAVLGVLPGHRAHPDRRHRRHRRAARHPAGPHPGGAGHRAAARRAVLVAGPARGRMRQDCRQRVRGLVIASHFDQADTW